jgi:hypothetical protein
MSSSGLPHSEIPGSPCAYHSPRLIAVSHVLHRLRMPRHPSYAVNYSTKSKSGISALCYYQRTTRMQKRFELEGGKTFRNTCKQSVQVPLRKEVIQPQVPLRLPCYDFTPITTHTFGTYLPHWGWHNDFWYTQLSWCDGRCVQGPGT